MVAVNSKEKLGSKLVGVVGVGTGVGVKVVAGKPKPMVLELAVVPVEVGMVEKIEGENRNGESVLPDADALEPTEGKTLEIRVLVLVS